MRKKRRAQRVKSAAVAVATIGVWAATGFLMVKSLDHPGESYQSGSEYMAQIEQHTERQTAVELKAAPMEEPVMMYDVPLDKELQLHIIQTCEEYHIDPAIVMAMIWRESGFRADAVGDNGNAFGLMQIWPYWHGGRMERLGCTDLLDPYQNVVVGIDYLAESIDRYDGDVAKALVAYNQGSYYETITGYALDVLDMAEELRCE
jgi:soluble lytic murein transglycosylase-like protein